MSGASLYTCEGEVISVEEAVNSFDRFLSDREHDILYRNLDGVVADPPREAAARPLTSNTEFGERKIAEVEESGDRSAYWSSKDLKLKGCNPREGEHSNVRPDFSEMREFLEYEPWGTVSGEDVVREVLGVACLEKTGTGNILRPSAVYRYFYGDEARYCLVERTETDLRAEDLYQDTAHHGEEFGFKHPIGLESYTERVTDILMDMHTGGFFRGAGDGHPGNTLVTEDGEMFLCDFSKFVVRSPGPEEFFARCLSEAIEASPIVSCEKMDVKGDVGPYMEKFEDVLEVYREASTFYRRYREKMSDRGAEIQGMFDGRVDIEDEIAGAEESLPVLSSLTSSMPTNIHAVLEKSENDQQTA